MQEILTQAEDVRRDEVFISGFRSPRVYGPYTFKSGGYVVRYEQSGERSNEQPLVVQVLRERDGRPLAVAVRATADAGKADVEVSGRVFVRVQSGRRYTLRFTPRR